MERLTLEDAINRSRKLSERHRWNSENIKLETSDKNTNEVYKNTCIQYANQEEQYVKWLEELKSYKEAEEQGLLMRLPVPLGSKIYWISTRDKQNPIIFEKYFVLGMLYFWNLTVFATREEAEKKLEEMKK
nr:MAG TPA: hypothetical protein [Caudoviricetes sp.]